MRCFCRLRVPKEGQAKSVVFVSGEAEGRLLAVSSRPLASNIADRYLTDHDLKDGLGQLKSCEFFEFERVFTGLQREEQVYNEVFRPSLQELYEGQSVVVFETSTNCRKLTDAKREMIGRIVAELEGFKNIEHNHAIIPSLRLFAIGKQEYMDLMSRNTGDQVSSMHSTHLINRRSFEIFEDKIDSRFQGIAEEDVEAIVLEVTVDRKARLNRFYWITCTPSASREITLNRLCGRVSAMRQGKSFDEQSISPNGNDAIVSTLDHFSCRILLTLSSRAEEINDNEEMLKFMTCGGLFSNQGTAPSYNGSYPGESDGAALFRSEHQDDKFKTAGKKERGTHHDTDILTEERKPSFEKKMHKLIDTYKSVVVKENYNLDGQSDLETYPTEKLRVGTSPALEAARTRRRLESDIPFDTRRKSQEILGVNLSGIIDPPVQ